PECAGKANPGRCAVKVRDPRESLSPRCPISSALPAPGTDQLPTRAARNRRCLPLALALGAVMQIAREAAERALRRTPLVWHPRGYPPLVASWNAVSACRGQSADS